MSRISTVVLTAHQRGFLDEPHFAVVATIGVDGLPHQSVTWYERDGDDLLISIPSGTVKHRHLRRDERLSVCVEDGFRYLTLSGTAELDDAHPEDARALYARIGARYAAGRSAGRGEPGEAPQMDAKTAELLGRDRVTLRLRVDHVHGNGFA